MRRFAVASSNDALREEVRLLFRAATWKSIDEGVKRIAHADAFAAVLADCRLRKDGSVNPGAWFHVSWDVAMVSLLAVMAAAPRAIQDKFSAFGMSVLSLGVLPIGVRLGELKCLPELKMLVLSGRSEQVQPSWHGTLSSAVSLERLRVVDLELGEILRSDTLQELELRTSSLNLGDVRVPKLRRLVIRDYPKRTLHMGALTSLRELRVEGAPHLQALKVDDSLSHLTKIEVSHAPTLRHAQIKSESLKSLHLDDVGVEELDIQSPSVRRLTIRRAPELRTVAPLATLNALRHVDLRGTPIRDLATIAALPHLSVVHLGPRTRYEDVPDPLRDRVRPARLRSKPKRLRDAHRPKPAKGALRASVGKLKTLLVANDYETIEQAAELARGLGEPEVFRALLEGTQIGPLRPNVEGVVSWYSPAEVPTLIPNALFDSAPRFRRYRLFAIQKLMAAAPPNSPMGIMRGELQHLGFVGRETKNRIGDVHVGGLGEFEALRVLELVDCGRVFGLDELRNPTLERLSISGASSMDLPPPRDGLQCLELALASVSTEQLALHTQLRRLRFAYPRGKRDLAFLAAMPELRELELAALPLGDVDVLKGCPKLEAIRITHVANPDPRLFRFAEQLRSFAVRKHNFPTTTLECLPTTIESIDLSGARLVGSLKVLGRFEKLRVLCLNETEISKEDVAVLHALPLERLELQRTKLGGGRLKKTLQAITLR